MSIRLGIDLQEIARYWAPRAWPRPFSLRPPAGLERRPGLRPRTPEECASRGRWANALHATLHLRMGDAPPTRLLEYDRHALGGRIWSRAREFVKQVCQDLRAWPQRYPDYQDRISFLAARQQEADDWLQLRNTLGLLHDMASDGYLAAQAEAAGAGREIVEEIEGEFLRKKRSDAAWLRLTPIARSVDWLNELRRSHTPAALRREGKKSLGAGKSKLTPRQERAKRALKDKTKGDIILLMDGLLRRLNGRGG